jgi:nucleoside recognition membrane protein YjiH
MSSGLRRFLILVVVAVLLFFVISQPEGAADVVQSILAIIGDALSSIATFFRSLF